MAIQMSEDLKQKIQAGRRKTSAEKKAAGGTFEWYKKDVEKRFVPKLRRNINTYFRLLDAPFTGHASETIVNFIARAAKSAPEKNALTHLRVLCGDTSVKYLADREEARKKREERQAQRAAEQLAKNAARKLKLEAKLKEISAA